jgi:hypothetical protein
MIELADLQRRLHNAILDGTDGGLAPYIRSDGLTAARRLQIHSNTAHLLLIEALTSNFPATSRIVDERFFVYAASEFVHRHSPRQPRLAEYGAELPDFLATFEPASSLPWLPDLARLEWAMLACQEAEDAPAVTATDLEEGSAHELVLLRHPGCRLLASPWPVDRIRSFALRAYEELSPDLTGDPVRLLVRRTEAGMMLKRLSGPDFALLGRLWSGLSLGAALDGIEQESIAVMAAALRDGLFAKP